MITINNISYHYGQSLLLKQVSFTFHENSFYGIIGPNGAGKSTLLQIIAGIRKPQQGEVYFHDNRLQSLSRKWIAQHIAVLQQGGLPPLGFTVREVVEMGRFPYQSWLGTEHENHAQLMEEAIYLTGLTHLMDRKLDQLSGGERQRVALAKLIVQQPEVILLDEPTTYLDIGYQQSMMEIVKAWQKQKNVLVIAVLHDLNLSSLYCDELLALYEGEFICTGKPEEVLTSQLVSHMYDANAVIIEHPSIQKPQLLLAKEKE